MIAMCIHDEMRRRKVCHDPCHPDTSLDRIGQRAGEQAHYLSCVKKERGSTQAFREEVIESQERQRERRNY